MRTYLNRYWRSNQKDKLSVRDEIYENCNERVLVYSSNDNFNIQNAGKDRSLNKESQSNSTNVLITNKYKETEEVLNRFLPNYSDIGQVINPFQTQFSSKNSSFHEYNYISNSHNENNNSKMVSSDLANSLIIPTSDKKLECTLEDIFQADNDYLNSEQYLSWMLTSTDFSSSRSNSECNSPRCKALGPVRNMKVQQVEREEYLLRRRRRREESEDRILLCPATDKLRKALNIVRPYIDKSTGKPASNKKLNCESSETVKKVPQRAPRAISKRLPYSIDQIHSYTDE